MRINNLIKAWGLVILLLTGCLENLKKNPIGPRLKVSDNNRYLEYKNGKPFFWLGCTSWGMPEWLTREEITYYLDNRKKKGFNLVQVCAFWGKREDDPVNFTLNPTNAYGFKAFFEENGIPDPMKPAVVEGGRSEEPNDYWDHVEFIIQEASKREMMIALLPVWGRRYVNAIHKHYAHRFFAIKSMRLYGVFLGSHFKNYNNIIWVLGGDVQADAGGNYLTWYRALAEGIITGITGKHIKWNEESPIWDYALMTYHPDFSPMKNSSQWFHYDKWLDFNMIETFKYRDKIYQAVEQDYVLSNPVKPTVLGEPAYEGDGNASNVGSSTGIQMRRQAFQSFMAGAAGFTYGAARDKDGNGPLFSPYKGWKNMLDMEGAKTMKNVKQFCIENGWPNWIPNNSILKVGTGKGELQKVAVKDSLADSFYIYFPDNSRLSIDLAGQGEIHYANIKWYNPYSGNYTKAKRAQLKQNILDVTPPKYWRDAVLLLKI